MVRIHGTLAYGKSVGNTLKKDEFLSGLTKMSFASLPLMLEILTKHCPVKDAKQDGIKLIQARLHGQPTIR